MIDHVSISAAGKGERMKASIIELGLPEDLPKPLMPTGQEGETLIGRIARQAQEVGSVAVYANYDTIRPIGEAPDLPQNVQLLVNRNIYGPLGPLYLDLEARKDQAAMAAGDFWADFSWHDIIAFHNKQDTPVTIMVAPSVPTTGGARFNVGDDGVVKSWERVERTTRTDLINIGAYIVDPEKLVMKRIRELGNNHKEDPFNDTMIAAGLMSAYVLPDEAYNVNNAEIYRAMLAHSKMSSEASVVKEEN